MPILASWSVSFDGPWWLLLAVGAIGPVLLAVWARRHGRHISALSVALQGLAVLAAAAALARPTVPIGPRASQPVLVLRDVSASCRRQADRHVPLPEDLPAERHDFAAAVVPAGHRVDANATHLAAALQLAAARHDRLAGVLLHTDGRFTDAGWRPAAATLGRTGLPVTIVPMDSPPADGRLVALTARREGDGKVHVEVTAEVNALMRRTLTVRRARPASGRPLLARELDLLAGQPATFHLTDAPPAELLATYAAELSAGDVFPENDAAEALVLPADRRVAVLGDSPAPPEGLAAPGVTAERLDAAAAPRAAAGWMDYAAVLLADARGTLLPYPSRAALEEAVRCGTGLVLLGAGPHATPADRDDPLNRAAALLANPYERRPLELVVVLDASGSMAMPSGLPGGRVKFDQAIEAVLSLRRHLTQADALRIITFSDSARTAYDSNSRPIDLAAAQERLAAVRPAGPTDVEPALSLAVRRKAPEGRDGLVLVVSDLATQPISRPDRLAAAFGRQRFSLAVVAVEPGAEKVPAPAPLEMLVSLLPPARIVRRADLTGLAEVFAEFLRDARGDALRRGRFVATGIRAVFGRPPGPLPEVQSYLACAAQRDAEVLARAGDQGDPLLAVRRVGLGQSVTLALPAAAADNPAWHAGGQLASLLGQAVQAVLRAPGDARFAGQVRQDQRRLRVTIDAADANAPVNLLPLVGRLAAADGEAEQRFALRQTAPGRYEGQADAPTAAAALTVEIAPDGPGGGGVVWRAAIPGAALPECQAVGADWANLHALAELTGGKITTGGRAAELGSRLAAARRSALWPACLAAAVTLMLAEWAAGRSWRRNPKPAPDG